MASCLQKIPSGNESRAEGENDEMGIPNYRERSRLNEIDSLVRTVEIVTEDIGMKFGINKCGILAMKRGQEVECDEIESENGEKIG